MGSSIMRSDAYVGVEESMAHANKHIAIMVGRLANVGHRRTGRIVGLNDRQGSHGT